MPHSQVPPPSRLTRVLICLFVTLVPTASSTQARTWSDDSGKFSIEAELVSVENGEVTLKRADGKLVHLPIDKLSKADQEFLTKKSAAGPAGPTFAPAETQPAAPPAARSPEATSGDAATPKPVNLKRDAKQIAATEQAVNELYKSDLAGAKTPQLRLQLARKLIQTAESETKPDVKFVLARKGAELAASAGNTQATFTGMNSVEAISDDPLPVWTDCLEILLAHNPDDPVPPSDKIETLISEAMAKDEFAAAAKLTALLSNAAKLSREPIQMAAAKAKASEVAAAKEEFKKFSAAEEQLKQNRADASAKAAAGRYLCLVHGDWDHGLPLLKDGNDKVLQPLVAAEQKANKTPAELAALGDAWIAAAKKIPLHTAAQDRGVYWLQQALPVVTGLTKIKIEKELAGHETKLGIDLLSKLDLQRDTFGGNWTMEGHNLKALPADVSFDKIEFPTPADMNHYQLTLDLIQRLPAGMSVLVPVGKRGVAVQVNPSQGKDGLNTINGFNTNSPKNPTAGPGSLVPNQRFTLTIDVLVKDGQAEIQVENSKRRVISWKGPVEQLDVDPFFAAPHRERIGIVAFADMTIFYAVRLIYSKSTSPGGAANH